MNTRSSTYPIIRFFAGILAATTILAGTLNAYADTAKPTPNPEPTKSAGSHSCFGGVDQKLDAEIENLPAEGSAQGATKDTFVDDPTTNINDVGDVGGDFEE